MLSHLYRLATSFRRAHGLTPNRLYLNRRHYQALRASLAGMRSETEIERFLGMEIQVSTGIEHPDVAWVTSPRRQAVSS
jgi:hypothetical protein